MNSKSILVAQLRNAEGLIVGKEKREKVMYLRHKESTGFNSSRGWLGVGKAFSCRGKEESGEQTSALRRVGRQAGEPGGSKENDWAAED